MYTRNGLNLANTLLMGSVVCGITPLCMGGTVYVAPTGDDGSDGLTWATPKQTVAAGLNAVVSGDEVWVAAGTYVERITLKDGVALYGGFVGSETDLAQRDWSANEQSRQSAQQRCTNHKTMNVLDKMPKSEQPEWIPRIRAIWQADSEKAARTLAAAVIGDLREAGYDRAASCLADDLDRCLTFYEFPEAHWSHLRTTNPIESVFASIRLRTNAAKRFKKTKSGVYLMHQILQRLSNRWRRLKSAHLCPTIPLPEISKRRRSKVA